MDEEPGAVINRLLEDGDVLIIDPLPPPPPLSATVVRHPVQQTLHNFGRIPELSPICCTTFLGSKEPGNKKSSPWISCFLGFWQGQKTQEIRHPGAGFLISWVFGRTKNTGNKNSRGWISYFVGFWPTQNAGNQNFSFRWFLVLPKTQGIRNPAPWISYFLRFWSGQKPTK